MLQLKADVTPSDADNTKLTWTSSNVNIIFVSSTGKITVTGSGKAKITAMDSAGKKKGSISLKTFYNPSGIKLLLGGEAAKSAEVVKGKGFSLKVVLAPDSTSLKKGEKLDPGSRKKITWNSSNEKVATVSSGKVMGTGTGTATITAKTGNGNTATVAVTVK